MFQEKIENKNVNIKQTPIHGNVRRQRELKPKIMLSGAFRKDN